jgi:hypothetical protein
MGWVVEFCGMVVWTAEMPLFFPLGWVFVDGV